MWMIIGVAFGRPLDASELQSALSAMDIKNDEVVTAEGYGVVNPWVVVSGVGNFVPFSGSTMALVHTGNWMRPQPGRDVGALSLAPPVDDGGTLNMTLRVPLDAESLSLDVAFFSAEYPEYVGYTYNDTLQVIVTGSAFAGDIGEAATGGPISVNDAWFVLSDSAALAGTYMDDGVGGSTDWLTLKAPVTPGDEIVLTIALYDQSDGLLDSYALIDNVGWGGPITGPLALRKRQLHYVDPKRSHVDGGAELRIIGRNLDHTCEVELGGIALPATASGGLLTVTTPPMGGEGLADMRVTCEGDTMGIDGAIAAFAEDVSIVAIEIESLTPHWILDTGGEVLLRGTGIDGSSISIAGHELVAAEHTDGLLLGIPALSPGVHDVTLHSPDGRTDQRLGALLVVPAEGM